MERNDAYNRKVKRSPAQNQNKKRHGPSQPTFDRNRGQNKYEMHKDTILT
jgi:hypothetical protein